MNTPTPTPRTDENITGGIYHPKVDADFARELERELADMAARAEAAEAALIAKDEAFNDCRLVITQNPETWGDKFFEQIDEIAETAIKVSPAETRSVIAGLREEVANLWVAIDLLSDPNCADWHRKDIAEKLRLKAAVSGAHAGAKGGNKS